MPRKKVVEIVLDTETTGLDYTKERIIEFAAVRLENGKVKDTYQTLINPEQHIRKSSIAIHGITEDMVADAPKESEILGEILDFIGDAPIVAHNAIFDYSFLHTFDSGLQLRILDNKRTDFEVTIKGVRK